MTDPQQTDLAHADTVDALEMTPDIIVDQLAASAEEYYKRGKLSHARDYLDQLVMMRPKESQYWTLLGVIHRRQKRRAAALHCFKKAAELTPKDRNNLVNLGETLIEVGKVPAGVELMRAVFEEGYDPGKEPEEQDEFTIRAGATLEFVQKGIRSFVASHESSE
ncbi:tetratricopeptide repeat protein [Persicimonas caeni]|uniref:Tetratricopeptide repeat protein n=1 Tax=Persicimonas caeni TaxID=2292766 RepID=A0A4Y6PSL9_PERCE|nr:tetratricopeptide repeat protein [Persicimonas caeni]QDG51109.1 tetratricopeptide repeat protein [Persicimonas caeni]QED32330.1 tetratricopeptide repeat protein [Persicimonas caeni]